MRIGKIAVMLGWLLAAGCSAPGQQEPAETSPRPLHAAQATSPLTTVGHLAGIEVARLTGDQRAVRGHIESMQKNMLRDLRIADASRPINPEAARAAVRPLKGVQSSVWIDHTNLLVMVGGGKYRSVETIDRICAALEPLGDTLAVVVNVQDVLATTSEGADTLSRNCQLESGERALYQQKRQVDVLDPELRRVFRGQQGGT